MSWNPLLQRGGGQRRDAASRAACGKFRLARGGLAGMRRTGVRLTRVRLTGIRLTGARLTGARLTGAGLYWDEARTLRASGRIAFCFFESTFPESRFLGSDVLGPRLLTAGLLGKGGVDGCRVRSHGARQAPATLGPP